MKPLLPLRCAAALFFAATLHLPGRTATTPAAGRVAETPTAGLATAAELRAKLESFVSEPRFSPALWGVKVVSLDSGNVLFEHHADRLLSPASNSKLYTGALALDRLGGDYRIVTPLLATAAVGADGELPGDLIVAGRGDPNWSARRTKRDFWTTFEPFVAELRRAGVRRIRGDIVADATWLRCPPQGASWAVDDLNDYYGAEISALSLEDNYVDLRVTPAERPGQPGHLEILQPGAELTLDNRTTTVVAGGLRELRVQRLPGETTVQIYGTLPSGDKEELSEITVPRPALWFAASLRAALQRAGITVDGRARSVRWPAAAPEGGVRLGEVRSPPLRELVAAFMKPSQNLETDLVFAHLGELQRTPQTPAWRRSDELAVAALEKFLADHQLRPDEVAFDEGSGLSRNNLTTAGATVDLLVFMARHRESAAFLASLPIAGVDGSLGKRFKGTPAEGNLRAKTGTLRWANSLSGYVTTAAGERLAFSFMLNRHRPPPERKSRDELDDLALLLTRYLGRE
jgi:D-alanyl-D-alanine carboxypeptidase/D-alanyl-D-alanine-endopeptidase (penicillin-binding protein 4)